MSNYEIARVDGTVTDSDARTREINRFQKDPNCKIFLGNPAAAGAGVTLTAANNAIYVSLSNQVASYMQSLDRIHRIGQNADQVNYFFLIANDTIEESEISRISRKHSAQSDLLMDLADPSIDLQSAIDELR
jgi:SNF2 family DNA or RNA helicase